MSPVALGGWQVYRECLQGSRPPLLLSLPTGWGGEGWGGLQIPSLILFLLEGQSWKEINQKNKKKKKTG